LGRTSPGAPLRGPLLGASFGTSACRLPVRPLLRGALLSGALLRGALLSGALLRPLMVARLTLASRASASRRRDQASWATNVTPVAREARVEIAAVAPVNWVHTTA